MRYVAARYKEESRDLAYRIYISDCLMHLSGATQRLADVLYPVKETRTADEIISGIKKKIEGGE
jgi:hypothetical protein